MYSSNVHIVDHPLVAHKLTILRDKGKVSRRAAEEKAYAEYDAFNKTQKIVSDFDREVQRLLQAEGKG